MATKEENKSVFETLSQLNVNGHTETKKNGNTELTYLSWAWAWAEVKKLYPDADYRIFKDDNNRPYIEDPQFGLMCMTSVTIEGQTHEMWLPVMNGANKAMRREAYTYKVTKFDYATKKQVEETKSVDAVTMFDVNKTIMRCLVKNLAMFGLGLYIYAGEDLPENGEPTPEDILRACKTPEELRETLTKNNWVSNKGLVGFATWLAENMKGAQK